MNRLVMLLALVGLAALSALAQPAVTRSGALKKRQFQDYAPTTLYVNGETGSDSNPCNSATAACATIQAAINKIPYNLLFNTVIEVAGASDGGFLDYAGFATRYETQYRPDGGNGTILIRGVFGTPTGLAGTMTNAPVTGYDAGGTRLDGGIIIRDLFEYSTVTSAGAGWTPSQLRGYFAQLVRPDGGLSSVLPIYDNTSDTIVPAYQVSAGTWATASTLSIVEPKTRLTANAPGRFVLIQTGASRYQSTLTLQRFELNRPTPAGFLASFVSGTSLSLSSCKIVYGQGVDSFAPTNGSNFSVTSSVIDGRNASRYFVVDPAENSTTGLSNNLAFGAARNLFTRAGNDGRWSFNFNTFFNLNSVHTVVSRYCCVGPDSSYTNNRFINMDYGIYAACGQTYGSFEAYANVFDTLGGNAISLEGNVSYWTNTSSGILLDSPSRNVGGYGLYVSRGARGAYLLGGIYGNSPTGALGDFALDGEAYSGSFLYSLPINTDVNTCIVGASTARVCSGDF